MKVVKWIVIGIVGLAVVGALIPSEEKDKAAPAQAEAAEKAPVRPEPKPEPKVKVAVPDVVGMNHQDAQDIMQANGLYSLVEKDCSGQDRMLLWDRNWKVEKQTPVAGRKVSENHTVSLCSVKKTDGAPEPEAPAEPAEPAEPAMNSGEENAVAAAQDYLDYSGFSAKGLTEQLTFEGYSQADATFAVANVDVDWNAEAVESAKDYLDYSSFSSQGLHEQLTFEGFTPEQAQYAVDQVY
jgi:hypothetical protein